MFGLGWMYPRRQCRNTSRKFWRRTILLHPQELTWNLKIAPWKRKLISQILIFGSMLVFGDEMLVLMTFFHGRQRVALWCSYLLCPACWTGLHPWLSLHGSFDGSEGAQLRLEGWSLFTLVWWTACWEIYDLHFGGEIWGSQPVAKAALVVGKACWILLICRTCGPGTSSASLKWWCRCRCLLASNAWWRDRFQIRLLCRSVLGALWVE